MNKVVLMGRLTADPELKTTQSGKSFVDFSLAVNRPKAKDATETVADFIRCRAWQKSAEFLCKYFGKGRLMAIGGHIQTGSYENKEGAKVFTTTVVVDDVHFTGDRGNNQNQQNGGAPQYQNQQNQQPPYQGAPQNQQYQQPNPYQQQSVPDVPQQNADGYSDVDSFADDDLPF